MESMWAFWLVLAIALAIVEVFTVSFYALWFAVGAGIAAIVAAIFPDLVWLQILIVAVVSLALIPITPKLAEKVHKRSPGYKETKFDVVGKEAIVLKDIEFGKYGVVKIVGHGEWTATTHSSVVLKPETKVVVEEKQGYILVVSPLSDG